MGTFYFTILSFYYYNDKNAHRVRIMEKVLLLFCALFTKLNIIISLLRGFGVVVHWVLGSEGLVPLSAHSRPGRRLRLS